LEKTLQKKDGHNRGPPQQTYYWRSGLLIDDPLEELFGCCFFVCSITCWKYSSNSSLIIFNKMRYFKNNSKSELKKINRHAEKKHGPRKKSWPNTVPPKQVHWFRIILVKLATIQYPHTNRGTTLLLDGPFVVNFCGSGVCFCSLSAHWGKGRGLWSWVIYSTTTSSRAVGRWFFALLCAASLGGDCHHFILSCKGRSFSKILQLRPFPIRDHLWPRRIFCTWLEVYTPEFTMTMIKKTKKDGAAERESIIIYNNK